MSRAELVTWCRIMAVGPVCAKPCDDCRRTSAVNAKLPDGLRVTLADDFDQRPDALLAPGAAATEES